MNKPHPGPPLPRLPHTVSEIDMTVQEESKSTLSSRHRKIDLKSTNQAKTKKLSPTGYNPKRSHLASRKGEHTDIVHKQLQMLQKKHPNIKEQKVVRERRNRTIKEYIYTQTQTHTDQKKNQTEKDDIPYLVFFRRQNPNGGSGEEDQWMKIGFKLIRVFHATINR